MVGTIACGIREGSFSDYSDYDGRGFESASLASTCFRTNKGYETSAHFSTTVALVQLLHFCHKRELILVRKTAADKKLRCLFKNVFCLQYAASPIQRFRRGHSGEDQRNLRRA